MSSSGAAAREGLHGLDTIDLRMLRVLQTDGRISNLKLAGAVHLSATSVLERVKHVTQVLL